MAKALIITIRSNGGGAETLINSLIAHSAKDVELLTLEQFFNHPKIIRYILFFISLINLSKDKKLILIGCEGLPGILALPAMILRPRCKFLLWVHCFFPDYKNFISFKNKILIHLSLILYKNKIYASPCMEKDFVPNPFDFTNYEECKKWNFKSPSVVIISSLAKLKNIDQVLDIFSKSSTGILQIFGDGPLRKQLEGKASKICVNTGKSVLFHGFVSDPWKQIEKSNSILVVNSHTEALPTVVLEAVANGVPSIIRRYKGSNYWQNLKSVKLVDEITPEIIEEYVSKLNRMPNSEIITMFDHDRNYLLPRHSIENFLSKISIQMKC